MLKKLVLGFALAGGLIAAPQQAVADDRCLLLARCFFDDISGQWLCPDPARQPTIQAYYFPEVDMTILIYADRDEVMIWRRGRATD